MIILFIQGASPTLEEAASAYSLELRLVKCKPSFIGHSGSNHSAFNLYKASIAPLVMLMRDR